MWFKKFVTDSAGIAALPQPVPHRVRLPTVWARRCDIVSPPSQRLPRNHTVGHNRARPPLGGSGVPTGGEETAEGVEPDIGRHS